MLNLELCWEEFENKIFTLLSCLYIFVFETLKMIESFRWVLFLRWVMWPLGLIGFCSQSRLKSDKENRLILQEKYYTKCANNGICWHKGDKYNVNQYFVFRKDKLFFADNYGSWPVHVSGLGNSHYRSCLFFSEPVQNSEKKWLP